MVVLIILLTVVTTPWSLSAFGNEYLDSSVLVALPATEDEKR